MMSEIVSGLRFKHDVAFIDRKVCTSKWKEDPGLCPKISASWSKALDGDLNVTEGIICSIGSVPKSIPFRVVERYVDSSTKLFTHKLVFKNSIHAGHANNTFKLVSSASAGANPELKWASVLEIKSFQDIKELVMGHAVEQAAKVAKQEQEREATSGSAAASVPTIVSQSRLASIAGPFCGTEPQTGAGMTASSKRRLNGSVAAGASKGMGRAVKRLSPSVVMSSSSPRGSVKSVGGGSSSATTLMMTVANSKRRKRMGRLGEDEANIDIVMVLLTKKLGRTIGPARALATQCPCTSCIYTEPGGCRSSFTHHALVSVNPCGLSMFTFTPPQTKGSASALREWHIFGVQS